MTSTDLEFIRLPAVLARRGVSRSAHLRHVAAGHFTPSVKIGSSAAWPRHEVDALMAAELNSATPKQMAQLVTELVAQRKALMPTSLRNST